MIKLPSKLATQAPEGYTHKIPLNAPMSGKVSMLDNLQSNELTCGLWGSGVAILSRASMCIVPFDGVVETIDLPSQRWILKAKNGLRVMIQIGLISQPLYAERLQPQHKIKQKCKTGEVLSYIDPIWLTTQLGALHCVVTVLNEKGVQDIVAERLGNHVDVMDELMQIYLNVPAQK